MTRWYLTFERSSPTVYDGYTLKSERVLVEAYERALAAAAGGPVVTTLGDYLGNPRDFYWREVKLVARRGAIELELRINQDAFSKDDDAPVLADRLYVVLTAADAPYDDRIAAWHAVRDELAKVGCVDRSDAAAITER